MEATSNVEGLKEIKRGALLSFVLILMFVGNLIFALLNFTDPKLVHLSNEMPVFLTYVYALISVLAVISAVLIWNWKKIGVYLVFIFTIISVVAKLYSGLSLYAVVAGLIAPAFLLFLVKNRWAKFN